VSTQPLRDWITDQQLNRDGPRGKVSKVELCRFVLWLKDRAEPFDPLNYERRFYSKTRWRRFPFAKLGDTRFFWPLERSWLSPVEIARKVKCHPSLIRKAIYARELSADHPTPYRWGISKKAWVRALPCSLQSRASLRKPSKESNKRAHACGYQMRSNPKTASPKKTIRVSFDPAKVRPGCKKQNF